VGHQAELLKLPLSYGPIRLNVVTFRLRFPGSAECDRDGSVSGDRADFVRCHRIACSEKDPPVAITIYFFAGFERAHEIRVWRWNLACIVTGVPENAIYE
jgi:hypothetical protein